MRAGHGILLIASVLLVLAVVMVNSAGLQIASEDPATTLDMLRSRPAALAGAALCAACLGACIPVTLLRRKVLGLPAVAWLLPLSIALLLAVHVPGIGREVNGARRWIDIAGVGFQPSEVAKWSLVLVLAAWFASGRLDLRRWRRGFLPPVVVTAVVCALVITEDLGTAMLVGGVAMVMTWAAGARAWHLITLAPPACAALFGAVMASSYRLDRLRAFLDPWSDPQGTGYHVVQSMSAVSGGGLSGLGLGNSVQKFGYLPEDTTDFIFAIVCEELGMGGALLVACLYLGLLFLGLSIMRRAVDSFSKFLVLGIMATIGIQASINMLVVTGLAPTKGIALPLLSSGGTGWILTGFCLGLVAAVDRATAVAQCDPAPCHA